MAEISKRFISPYWLWLNSAREMIKKENPGFTIREITQRADELWRNMEDKSEWECKAAKMKDDYHHTAPRNVEVRTELAEPARVPPCNKIVKTNGVKDKIEMDTAKLQKNQPANCYPNKIPSNPSRSTDPVCSEATFRFKIENASRIKGPLLSPPFYVQNLPWKIMAKEGLGFFLQCNGEDTSTTWSCFAHADLRLLSVVPGADPFERKIWHTFTRFENDWGFSCFLNWFVIVNPANGYIQNDAITLEVYVKASPPLGILVGTKKRSENEGLQSNKEQTCQKKELEAVEISRKASTISGTTGNHSERSKDGMTSRKHKAPPLAETASHCQKIDSLAKSTVDDTTEPSEGQLASRLTIHSVSPTISSILGESTTKDSSANNNANNNEGIKCVGDHLKKKSADLKETAVKERKESESNHFPMPMKGIKQERPAIALKEKEMNDSQRKRFPMPVADIKKEKEQEPVVDETIKCNDKPTNREASDDANHGSSHNKDSQTPTHESTMPVSNPNPVVHVQEVESGVDQPDPQNDNETVSTVCRNKFFLEEDLPPTGSDDRESSGATTKELIATTPWTVSCSGHGKSGPLRGQETANDDQIPKRKAHSATVSRVPEVASKEASRKRTAAKPRTKPILTKAGAGVAKKRKISAPQQVEAVSNGACGKRKTDLLRSKDLQEAPVRKQKKSGQKNAQIANHMAPTNAANGPLGIGQPLADQGHRPESFSRSSSSGVRIHNDLSQPQHQPIVPEANPNPPQQNAFSMFGGPRQLPEGTSNNINQMLTTLWEQFIGLMLSNISNQMDQVAVQSSALYGDPQQMELLCSIFGCIAFLNGRCLKPYCRYPHNVSTEEEVFQKLSSRSLDDIVTTYRFLTKRDDLFGKYFPVFAQVMGLKNMHLHLVDTVADCEQLKRPIAYYKHIVEGLKASGTSPEQAVRLILSKHTKRSFHQISVLIELILDTAAEAIPTFLPTLQEFSRVKDYYFDIAAVNRLLEFCVRSTLPNKDLDQFVCNLLLKLPAGEEQLVNTGLLLEFTEKVRSDPILNLDVEEIVEKYGSVAAMKPHQ